MQTGGCARILWFILCQSVLWHLSVQSVFISWSTCLTNHAFLSFLLSMQASIIPCFVWHWGSDRSSIYSPEASPRPELVLGLGSILCHGKPSPFLPLSPWRRSNTSIVHLNPLARSNSSTGMILIWQRLQLIPLSHVRCWRSMIPAVLKLHYLLRHAKLCRP